MVTEDSKEKPRTASLFKSMALETVTLDEALRLLAAPLARHRPGDGEEVIASNGRYGPFLKKGSATRARSRPRSSCSRSRSTRRSLSSPSPSDAARRSRRRRRELGADPERQADRPRRPLRALRHRRRDERQRAPRRRPGRSTSSAVELLAERRRRARRRSRRGVEVGLTAPSRGSRSAEYTCALGSFDRGIK